MQTNLPKPIRDVMIVNHGSLYLFEPTTVKAQEWLRENVSEDSQWFGDALAVEPRYASDLANALIAEGFIVR